MSDKRYFKRMWEEEYYIFDSNTISESDFEEKLEYQLYKAFEDSMMGDEVVNRLNEQHETIERLKVNINELLSVNVEKELLEENEQLKTVINRYEKYSNKKNDELNFRQLDILKLKEENDELKLLIKKVLETTPIEHSLAIDLKNSIKELYK